MLALVAMLAAACGGQGTVGAKALEQQSKAVQSLAAEGALLAQDSADGKSTGIYPPGAFERALEGRRLRAGLTRECQDEAVARAVSGARSPHSRRRSAPT